MHILAFSTALALAPLDPVAVLAQTPPTATAAPVAAPADVASLDAIVAALYDVISGPAGPRDWARFHSLFQPGAVMGSARQAPDGAVHTHMTTPAAFATGNAAQFMKQGFYEQELGRSVNRFGPLVQVMSAYQIREAMDAEPKQRGVNSITLFDDGRRLWITSITWAGETPSSPLPADLIPIPVDLVPMP